jgi:hypothetical protein
MSNASYNWYYDWSIITKNDARCVVEVRQYNSQSIPNSIPWKTYDPTSPIPFLMPPTGSVHHAHWSFMATHASSSIQDLSGYHAPLVNAKSVLETNNFWVSRRGLYPILGGGSTGYSLDSAPDEPSLNSLSAGNANFTWETYIYGIDATNPAASLSFIHSGSAGQGYAIEFDFVGKQVLFQVGSASVSATVSSSIADLVAESGYPANYHYFAGSYINGGGLYLYVDGILGGYTAYTGGVVTGSVAFKVRHGESLFVDEFSIWSGFMDANLAFQRYTATKERQRFLGLVSGSYQPYHQARFIVYASGSQEFELHSFSLRGLQSTSASVFDPRITDLYSLPIFTSTTGSV